MNGFADRGLDESNFGESDGVALVRSFDAFPKTKSTYLTRTRHGALSTIILLLTVSYLVFTELARWFTGTTTHAFAVEKGVAHELQINLDVVVRMPCHDLHVNVQDAAGDRIVAGEALRKDATVWSAYTSEMAKRERKRDGEAGMRERKQYADDEDVHDYLAGARGRRKFKGTPPLRRGEEPDSCRIFGSIEGNKVQGDFHVTARGHGYMDWGGHLDHSTFNFTHHINELSFGPFFPSLSNPLDDTTSASSPTHFHKYQYYLSLVPTIYTDSPHRLPSNPQPPNPHDTYYNPYAFAPHTIYTNQYAVTEQSRGVSEMNIPGIFVKYDIEPLMLLVSEESAGFGSLLVRLVNVVAGCMVAGQGIVGLVELVGEVVKGRRGFGRRGTHDGGLLNQVEKETLD